MPFRPLSLVVLSLLVLQVRPAEAGLRDGFIACYALVAAAVHRFSPPRARGTQTAVQESEAPVPVSPARKLIDLMPAHESFSARVLFHALTHVRFLQSRNPRVFLALNDAEPLARLFERGIVGHQRDIYRSLTAVRKWNDGYDQVRFAVQHPDETESVLVVYKPLRPWDYLYGGVDDRPTHHAYFVALGDGQFEYYASSDGVAQPLQVLSASQAAGLLEKLTDEPVAAKRLFKLDYATQLVTP